MTKLDQSQFKDVTLWVAIDTHPTVNVAEMFLNAHPTLDRRIKDNVQVQRGMIRFRVPSLSEARKLYNTFIGWVSRQDWYWDDTKCSSCTVGCEVTSNLMDTPYEFECPECFFDFDICDCIRPAIRPCLR